MNAPIDTGSPACPDRHSESTHMPKAKPLSPQAVSRLLKRRAARAPVLAGIAAALAAAAGCAPSPEITARNAAQPAAIATAICLQSRANESCDNARLPEPASEIAYATCLDYNRRDLLRCSALRLAYEADLHAHFGPPQSRAGSAGPPLNLPRLGGTRVRDLHHTAEELYKASNSDADTFQAALLIPEIRRKIEAVLGHKLTDAALEALVGRTRAEAVYWYEYMQRLEHGESAEYRFQRGG
jgi:hypothetical protein